jgi:hypothetical protein
MVGDSVEWRVPRQTLLLLFTVALLLYSLSVPIPCCLFFCLQHPFTQISLAVLPQISLAVQQFS